MKASVDLTENRDFRDRNGEISIPQLFKIGTLPWEFKGIKRILSTLNNKIELIYTGDKEERQSKKQCQQYMNECECCGLDLSRIPWKNKYKLCEKCYARLENNEGNHKPFWRNEKIGGYK
ncbi:hypothetical protein [Clostridium botulinum]|uniref:Uncharacterized protein n=2 Tax=Clostridium botulinum TaxID=1491 RepID=A0A9Q1UVS2_CLOBO|nr:hypothetical protein [Clostridium botulinum]AEB77265.1 hypothetical protein CbC4_4065 [Clostridium botulinum BKT015925]KEH96263.1 hypothetical protein Y848_13320 [Clostridium botulinum C/D str. Sp77]KLU74362.1 hypothetical protein CBC3_p0064 [Clostridium botulinum V891]KOA75699.1 hypothetical protein ADU78_07180 [Clostridium botulinum]KOA79606.1 hypothetical protein ADU77_04295 [Clostridium botulinum]